jgi:O-succinylbenzoic acid--CoA ligase
MNLPASLKKSIWINGREISYGDILNPEIKELGLRDDFEISTIQLIKNWLSGQSHFELPSSGSTGNSKKIIVSREQVEASAKMTLQTLGIREGINAVLCLNTRYTAGIMLVIRSLIGKLNLFAITPSSDFLQKLPEDIVIDFLSVVPNQLFEILNQSDYLQFNSESIILVGGASLHAELVNKSDKFPGKLYLTFGMAETLSHIALRKINGKDKSEYYETLGNVTVRNDDNGCLVINSPHLFKKEIITKDVVEIIDKRHFSWIGRADQVIMSGAIKIQVERLEEKIGISLHKSGIRNNFFITPAKDMKLGQKVILVVEDSTGSIRKDELTRILRTELEVYLVPKEIRILPGFKYTETQKIDRINTRALLNLPA